jgi:hypothetical protein
LVYKTEYLLEAGGNILKDNPNRTKGMRRNKTVVIKLRIYRNEVKSFDFIIEIW